MPAEDNRRFVIRDRNWHPKALTPDYKTSIARSPRQALVSIPQSISETTGPDFSHLKFAEHDNDLLLNFNNGGLPIGERIIVSGRVMDQYGKPIPHINPAIKYPKSCCVDDTWMPEIRTDSLRGHAMDALLVSPYLGPEMHILIPRIASRHIPEAGAVCGSSARTDLCGGAAGNCRPYRDRLSNTGPRP